MKRYNRKKNIRWNTMRILAAGFLFVIVTGAVLLWLPVSNQKPIEFFDALFTSASAVCVTGLVTIIPANSIHIIWKSNFVDIDTDWRTWNHCLCNGILFSLTQTDYCQGAYGYPGDV